MAPRKAATKTLRAAIYTRVSSDPKQRWRSVTDQESECRAIAAHRGWEVVEVFCDNDRSASRYSKTTRPEFERLQKLIASGGCDVLLTWEGSRGQRDLGVFVQLRDLLEKHKVLWSYEGDVLDMSKARDRKRAAEDATDAEYEVDRTRERIMRSVRAGAAAGRPHGRRLFGYQRLYDQTTGAMLGQEAHPEEAATVRRIFAEYLSGKGVRTIAAGLNASGITTGTGARWNDAQVRRVLVNPAYVAKRVHQGEVVGEATWPALVTVDQFERVQARLVAKRTSATRQTRTANLLSGVGRCGKCGGKVQRGHDRDHRKVYVCKTSFCVARDLGKLDDYVTAAVLERLARPDAQDALSGGSPGPEAVEARERVMSLKAKLDDAIHQFTEGKLSAGTLAKIEGTILPAITEAEREARRAVVPLDVDLPDDVDSWWDGMTTEQRREVVGALVEAVVIKPSKRGNRGPRWDPAAQIEWRRSANAA